MIDALHHEREAEAGRIRRFIQRRPIWSFVIFLAVIILLWAVFAVWPKGLVEVIGRKKVFLNALFNGVTLGGLYFLVASGFTLIFGLMRNVNLAHGSLYLLGGYVGYEVADATGWWFLSFIAAFILIGLLGVVLRSWFSGGWRAKIFAKPWSPSASRSSSLI